MTGGVVGLGLLIAILVDRVRYESDRQVGDLRPAGDQLRGGRDHLEVHVPVPGSEPASDRNAQRPRSASFGLGPTRFTQEEPLNNFALIFIGIWMWTGFAMVILSAGLKGISTELLEAARVDGANEWQVFRGIILPLLMPTIFVVGTTIVITALKSFDIVFTVTNGNFGTDVIAREMWQQMFTPPGNFGRASAVAIVLLLAIIPFMAINVRRFREQEAIR